MAFVLENLEIDDQLVVEEENQDTNITDETAVTSDMYWNYKSGEFLIDSLFAIGKVFEKYGDGLGMLIVSKMILPFLHELKHSNYTNSIHRFITRMLCECTPREGLKLIHERFCNKEGKHGGNIFRDRRMEFRIGVLKEQIRNLGPNFDEYHVQLCNKVVDIKEELFYNSRVSHGVKIRSGNHNARDDSVDYATVMKYLKENRAHCQIKDRSFGDYNLPHDLNDYYDRAHFYRWISTKNKEAATTLKQKLR